MDDFKGRVILDDREREEIVKRITSILQGDPNNPLASFFNLQRGLIDIFTNGYKRGFTHGVEALKEKMN